MHGADVRRRHDDARDRTASSRLISSRHAIVRVNIHEAIAIDRIAMRDHVTRVCDEYARDRKF